MKRQNRTVTINQELAYQLHTTGERENNYFLPTVADPTDKQVERYVSLIHSTIEKNGDLARVVRIIRDEAYSSGIKHMDQMHSNTEKN